MIDSTLGCSAPSSATASAIATIRTWAYDHVEEVEWARDRYDERAV